MAVKNNRYLASKFYNTQEDENGIVSRDPIAFRFNSFLDFMRDKRAKVVTITESNEGSPDLISFKEYGTHEFWWVVMYVNKIQDPINELTAGTRIALPFLSDIETFRQSREAISIKGESVTLR